MTIKERIEKLLRKMGIFVLNSKYDIDSLKRISLWYELEREFDVIIDDEDFWKTQDNDISSLIELIEKYIKK